ncbi:MAG: sulfoxide reductase heme-binding subunit YedZ [Oleispira sp.]|jgi:sulfoxide reductase heme-binding subunit YedZ
MPIFVRRCLTFSVLFAPFAYIFAQVVALQMGDYEILGPEPGKAIVWFTGQWTFNVLLLTLAVSPVRQWLGLKWPLIHRRMLGLFVMFYATLHLLSYMAFLLAWQWQDIGSELVERPYLTLGFLAWVLLIPLSITSTKGWQKRLKRKWKSLHKVIYPIAVLCAVHYLLQIRSSWFDPSLYALITLVLLGQRFSLIKIKGFFSRLVRH